MLEEQSGKTALEIPTQCAYTSRGRHAKLLTLDANAAQCEQGRHPSAASAIPHGKRQEKQLLPVRQQPHTALNRQRSKNRWLKLSANPAHEDSTARRRACPWTVSLLAGGRVGVGARHLDRRVPTPESSRRSSWRPVSSPPLWTRFGSRSTEFGPHWANLGPASTESGLGAPDLPDLVSARPNLGSARPHVGSVPQSTVSVRLTLASQLGQI